MWLARPNADLPDWASFAEHVHGAANALPWRAKPGNSRRAPPSFQRRTSATSALEAAEHLFSLAQQPLLDELEAARSFNRGWDGPKTLPPAAAAIDAAIAFVKSIPPAFFLPEVAFGTDGEVNMSWRTSTYYVDASFYDASGASVYARIGEGKETMSGVTHFEDLPAKVHVAIAAGA